MCQYRLYRLGRVGRGSLGPRNLGNDIERSLGSHRLDVLHRELLESPPALMENRMNAVIPYSAAVERMGERRAPLAAFAPADDGALLAYAELWLETSAGLGL